MNEHPIQGLMETVMANIKDMIDANTIIGKEIVTADGTTIIPVSKVSVGFASGGSEFTGKNTSATGSNPFGGGSGAGVNIAPVAFLIISNGEVKLMPITMDFTPVDRAIGMIPEMVDKISAMVSKKKSAETE